MKNKSKYIIALLLMLVLVPTSARRNEFREIKQDKNITYLHIPSFLTSGFVSKKVKINKSAVTKVKGMHVIMADNTKGVAHVDKWFRTYIDNKDAEPLVSANQDGANVEVYLLDSDKRINKLIIYSQDKDESCVLIMRGKVEVSDLKFD